MLATLLPIFLFPIPLFRVILSRMFKALNLFPVIVFLTAVSVFAQTAKPTPTPRPLPSLKTLPDTSRYIDKDKTFSIWMPETPKEIELIPPADPLKGSSKTMYKWDVDEGFFAVTRSVFEHRTLDTEKDLAEYLAQVKEAIGKGPDMKLIAEKPSALEAWRGIDLTYKSGDRIKTIIRVLARGNKVYTLSVTIDHNVKDAEMLVSKALDSLAITEKN